MWGAMAEEKRRSHALVLQPMGRSNEALTTAVA